MVYQPPTYLITSNYIPYLSELINGSKKNKKDFL
jgi:hypothetical protein